MNSNIGQRSAIPYIRLALLRDLSCLAGRLLGQTVNELRKFLRAPRKPQAFRSNVKVIGFYLGLLYKAIDAREQQLERPPDNDTDACRPARVDLRPSAESLQSIVRQRLFLNKPCFLKKLESIAIGFDSDNFEAARKVHSMALPILSVEVSQLSLSLPTSNE